VGQVAIRLDPFRMLDVSGVVDRNIFYIIGVIVVIVIVLKVLHVF
jgi:hypothetical protein